MNSHGSDMPPSRAICTVVVKTALGLDTVEISIAPEKSLTALPSSATTKPDTLATGKTNCIPLTGALLMTISRRIGEAPRSRASIV